MKWLLALLPELYFQQLIDQEQIGKQRAKLN
jgi:hypothetical protein